MYCLICHGTIEINYTCRCRQDYGVCFLCSKDLRATKIQRLFGIQHMVNKQDEAAIAYMLKYVHGVHLDIHGLLKSYKGIPTPCFGYGTTEPYDPDKVDERWVNFVTDNGTLIRVADVIHHIRSDCDTVITIISDGQFISKINLCAAKEYPLNLPVCTLYSRVCIKTEPPTPLQCTFIRSSLLRPLIDRTIQSTKDYYLTEGMMHPPVISPKNNDVWKKQVPYIPNCECSVSTDRNFHYGRMGLKI